MTVLGLILIAAAVVLGFGVGASSADDATLEVFGADLGVTVAGVYFTGAATAAVLILGLWLLKKGTGRGYRRRKEVKDLRHQVDTAAPTVSTEHTDRNSAADRNIAADHTDAPPDPTADRPTNP
jgi:hypothetical protein